MAEIVPVVSEAIEAFIRDNLPSQRGFGEDMQASNVIFPVLDITPTAEGTQTPNYLVNALAFGSNTAFSVSNGTSALTSTPGFYRVVAVSGLTGGSNTLEMTDGLSTKNVWRHLAPAAESTIDLIFFVAAGITLNAVSSSVNTNFAGSIRQIADVNGNLVNPIGFTPQ